MIASLVGSVGPVKGDVDSPGNLQISPGPCVVGVFVRALQLM